MTQAEESSEMSINSPRIGDAMSKKRLRRIYGPVQEGDIWRIRNNEELNRSIKREDNVKFIKSQRIRRLGHVKRMEVGTMPRKMMEGRLFIGRRRGEMCEMGGWRCSRLESNEDKAVDREDERQRAMETSCWGGQGSPRAVAPRGRNETPSPFREFPEYWWGICNHFVAFWVSRFSLSAFEFLFCGFWSRLIL